MVNQGQKEEKKNIRKNLDILDITKFILSFFIVAIHAKLFPGFLYPWLRLAIPLFFIISSYLLHTKLINSDKKDRKRIIKNYIKRQLTLYAFWFVVLLPVTIFVRRDWFSGGVVQGIWTTISQTLFSSTFIASWYISATILGTLIVEKISNKIKNKAVLIPLFLMPNLICCLISSYGFLWQNNQIITSAISGYELILTSPVFSFPVSLIYIYVGKLFAEKKETDNKQLCKTLCLLVFLVLLFIEWKITSGISGEMSSDCLFMLLPCAYLIMDRLLRIKITVKHAKTMRKISVIMYPLHASLILILRGVIGHFVKLNETAEGIVVFITTILLCLLVCAVILKLENKKPFKFLRYSH